MPTDVDRKAKLMALAEGLRERGAFLTADYLEDAAVALAEAYRAGAETMREACAAHLDQRAAYFEAAPAHRTVEDVARSYRQSAKELRALPLTPPAEGGR
jgi:hypothetical protein